MKVLRIRLYPDPVLRVRCPEVTQFDAGLRDLAGDMIETMHSAVGVGLAAPQVGIETRLIVVDASAGEDRNSALVMVNPVIEDPRGESREAEGCLSIPAFTEKVDRPTEIHVRAQKLDGTPFELEAEDFLTRVICHEVDHLNGVLFIDRLTGLRREKGKRHLRRMRKEALEV